MFLFAVTHNFLESGHSHMECDSMHSAFERELCDHLAVHEEFHGWYRALPISTRNIDQLPEPATDDSGDDDGES